MQHPAEDPLLHHGLPRLGYRLESQLLCPRGLHVGLRLFQLLQLKLYSGELVLLLLKGSLVRRPHHTIRVRSLQISKILCEQNLKLANRMKEAEYKQRFGIQLTLHGKELLQQLLSLLLRINFLGYGVKRKEVRFGTKARKANAEKV